MTYWTLNAIFLAVVALVAIVAALRIRSTRPWVAIAITLGVLLVMTAVFDNVMIGVGLVGYESSLISGAFVGIAPLEDFAYAVAAAILLPSLWMLLPAGSRASGTGVSAEPGA
ncbi:lycopene cyclase domain-containing protein [Agreia bicolorata]|uniref:Lycopene cyclase domain-containing protein n=1 Tax=Agreia bicolorata TaxID=110935 RepID=A0A1T4XI26_9MICO|nr:lycopene cyclase domain-containing protein [Agreia bicolorata]SKA88771.1 lycopene cyclase domain-containing protein [Agreia bicolorata]